MSLKDDVMLEEALYTTISNKFSNLPLEERKRITLFYLTEVNEDYTAATLRIGLADVLGESRRQELFNIGPKMSHAQRLLQSIQAAQAEFAKEIQQLGEELFLDIQERVKEGHE